MKDVEMRSASPVVMPVEVTTTAPRRYDPRYDDQQAPRRDREREIRDTERERDNRPESRSERNSPEMRGAWIPPAPGGIPLTPPGSTAPGDVGDPIRLAPISDAKDGRRRRGGKDRDSERSATPSQGSINGGETTKKERKKRESMGEALSPPVGPEEPPVATAT